MSKKKQEGSELLSLATTSTQVAALASDMKVLAKLGAKGDAQLQTLVAAVTASFVALQAYLERANNGGSYSPSPKPNAITAANSGKSRRKSSDIPPL